MPGGWRARIRSRLWGNASFRPGRSDISKGPSVPAGWTLRYRRSREQPSSVGDGSTLNNTQPYVFLVTDGAQDNQVKGVPNGGWSGSNHATVIDPTTVCK